MLLLLFYFKAIITKIKFTEVTPVVHGDITYQVYPDQTWLSVSMADGQHCRSDVCHTKVMFGKMHGFILQLMD